MSDTPDSSYTRHLILKMLQRIVAKRISDMVIERLSGVQTDMYTFYALILNQFIENENKQFQFIREGIKAYSDPDGVWFAKDEDDPPEHYVQSVALPLKLDQYLNTIIIDEKYQNTFVFDNELVEEYFKFSYSRKLHDVRVRARIHHDIHLEDFIFDTVDDLCSKVYNSMDGMKFKADIDDYSYETILNALLMSNSSIDEVENFLSKINEWTSDYQIYDLTSDIEKNIMSELMDAEIDKICSSTLINNPLVDNIRSKLGSIPIKEPPILRKEGVNVNFLLDLDEMVDPISRISFYWSYRNYRYHAYTQNGASNCLRVARLILSDRDWLNDTCDMIKKNWSSEFKYNIYNTSIKMTSCPSHYDGYDKVYKDGDFLDDYHYSNFSMFKFYNDYSVEYIFYKINGLISIYIDERSCDSEDYFIYVYLEEARRCIRYYRTAQDSKIVFNLLNLILPMGRRFR